MSTGMSVRMATMQMQMRRNNYHQSTMDQRSMWSTEGIVGDVEAYECEHGDDLDADEEA